MGWNHLGGEEDGGLVAEEVVVGIAATGDLADLGVPLELGIEAVEGPEAADVDGEASVGLGLPAPLPHRVDMLPLRLLPPSRVLLHPQDQILLELHHEPHPLP
ncbi:hypothetical protein BHE74_00017605 [Ensete ventricosum]|nr:hypothetical protein BHE74_00017605 [Ensete ventricosum]